jgi:hypothetical protein
MASSSGRFCQDVHQLRALYAQRAGTFLSNAGVLQVFGVNDHDSAKLVSDLLGQETVVFETMSRALDADETGISFGVQHVGGPRPMPHCGPMSSCPQRPTCRSLLCRSRVRGTVPVRPGNGRSSPPSSASVKSSESVENLPLPRER